MVYRDLYIGFTGRLYRQAPKSASGSRRTRFVIATVTAFPVIVVVDTIRR